MTLEKGIAPRRDPDKLGFLDLPTELRLRVYGILFFDAAEPSDPPQSFMSSNKVICGRGYRTEPSLIPQSQPSLEILQTCSLVHLEAAYYDYSNVTFGVVDYPRCCPRQDCPTLLTTIEPLLEKIGKISFSSIRHLYIDFGQHSYEIDDDDDQMDKHLRRNRELIINSTVNTLRRFLSDHRLKSLALGFMHPKAFGSFIGTPAIMYKLRDSRLTEEVDLDFDDEDLSTNKKKKLRRLRGKFYRLLHRGWESEDNGPPPEPSVVQKAQQQADCLQKLLTKREKLENFASRRAADARFV